MSSILNVISLPPEWFEELLQELDEESSRCSGIRWLAAPLPANPELLLLFCGIEYMGITPRLVPGTGPPGEFFPNVFSFGAGNGGGDFVDAGTDLDKTSGKFVAAD